MTADEILKNSMTIAREYQDDGLTLTLRQLYYQHVARGLLPSGDKVYKRIGQVLTKARFEGDFPIDWIEDRGRNTGKGDWAENLDDLDAAEHETLTALQNCPYWYLRRSRWWGQPEIASVWAEKEALSGVFEKPCKDLGVALFPCKGYPSVSALWAWHKSVVEARMAFWDAGLEEPRPIILYFGDHDPDGWEIPRSALRNLYRVQDLDDSPKFKITMERVALNMDQIRQYDPPPFPAKVSSARYQSYIREHDTDEAWELDALEPRVLQSLIRDSVSAYFDKAIWKRHQTHIKQLRSHLVNAIQKTGFTKRAFEE